jgi:hypothetical protein
MRLDHTPRKSPQPKRERWTAPMLTYLPDDSARCRVKELMASVRPAALRDVRELKESERPTPPRFDYPPRLRVVKRESLQT